MELAEVQSMWQEMTQELEQQQKLTNQIIIDMTKEKYQKNLNRIAQYEGLGSVICILMAIYLLFQFNLLDTWYLKLFGLFTISFLIAAPSISMIKLYQMINIPIDAYSFQDMIQEFHKRKQEFLTAQQFLIYGCFLLIITILPVTSKIISGKDILQDSDVWYWYLPVMFIGLFLFSRWAYGCYQRMIRSSENVLRELGTVEN